MNAYVQRLTQPKMLQAYKRLGLTYVGLFGSSAREEDEQMSDVDVLVDFSGKRSFFELADVMFLFQEAVEKKVDLVMKTRVKKQFLPFIERDLITLYEEN